MGFVDFQTRQKTAVKEKPRIQTVTALQSLAQERSIELPQPKRSTGLLGGIQRFAEILSTGEFAVGGILAGKSPITGIREKISPSDVLLKGIQPETRIGKIAKGAAGLALDIGLDPTTYLTLGTGSAIKVVGKTGAKVALSKTGKEMLKEFAEEVGEKSARVTLATLAEKEGGKTLLERGGLKTITRALEKTGQKATKENVEKALREGVEGLRAKGGLKFTGLQIAKPETLKRLFEAVHAAVIATKPGKELSEGLGKIGNAVGHTFSRDYGLDAVAKKNKQGLLDSLDNARNRISEHLTVVFAGTNKAQREAVSFAIEGGAQGITSLEKEMQPVARRVRDILKSVGKEEEKRGILNSWIDDYVTHAYKNKERANTIISALRGGQPSALLKFAKERRIPTIKEAEELGLEPIKDIAEILQIRLLASEKAKLTQDFLKTTALTKGIRGNVKQLNPEIRKKILELNENMVRLSDVATGVPNEFKNFFIPAHIADDLGKINKRIVGDKDINTLLRGYDKVLNFFKGSVTVLFPAFHGRNAISNVSQVFLDVGAQAINPQRHKEAVSIMTGGTGELVTDIGTKIPYDEIRRMAKAKGVLQNKITRVDVDRAFAEPVSKEGIKKIAGTPVDVGRAVGRAIEGEARMVNFIANLKRGYDFDDAAVKVKEFLFDYDNLSPFEKDFMRRAIPFYTWTRKNIALQLKALATVPGKPIAQMKVLRAMEEMFGEPKEEEEKQFAPDFVMAGMNVLLERKGDDRTFLIGFDLPIENAFEFFNKPLRETITSIAPFLKVPLEAATGQDFFKEKAIKEDDSGRSFVNYPQNVKDWLDYTEREVTTKDGRKFTIQKVDPEKKWLLSQIETFTGMGRLTSQSFLEPLATFYKMLKGKEVITMEDKSNVVRFLIGVRAFTINIEQSKQAHEKNDVRQLQDILERHGVIGRFERAFILKEQKQEEKKTGLEAFR